MSRALTPTGRVVLVGAGRGIGGSVGRMAAGAIRQRVLRQPVVAFISWESIEDLEALRDLLAAGAITPVIERTYQLDEVAEAVRYLETGQARAWW